MHDIRAIRENPAEFDAASGAPRAFRRCRTRSSCWMGPADHSSSRLKTPKLRLIVCQQGGGRGKGSQETTAEFNRLRALVTQKAQTPTTRNT
jgi:hypothetical protein